MNGDEGLANPTGGVKKAAIKPAARSKKKAAAPKKAAPRRKKLVRQRHYPRRLVQARVEAERDNKFKIL